ncbi:MAG: type II toxin-antitoxin system VapC family toxin [Chloroflexota bacterium]
MFATGANNGSKRKGLMPTNVALDTSVIIKWFRQEEVWAEQALKLRAAYLEGIVSIMVPWLLIYEVANVLRYKKEYSTEQVQTAVQSLFDMQLTWIEPGPKLINQAVHLAHLHDVAVYDATFAAIAEENRVVFFTANDRFVRRTDTLEFVQFLSKADQFLTSLEY